MEKRIVEIENILEASDKAEILETLGDALSAEGSKVVIITGIPNKETGSLDIVVSQSGHLYAYEERGFIEEALHIVEDYAGGESEEKTDA